MKIGLGCWQLGSDSYGKVTQEDASSLISAAQEEGIEFFDTSPTYGNGLSEIRLGEFLNQGKKNIVSTKVGMLPHSGTQIQFDFTLSSLLHSLDHSRRNLRREVLDVVQLHSPPKESLVGLDVSRMLSEVSQRIPVSNWGISLKSPSDISWAMELFEWRYIQLNFSLMDQRALQYKDTFTKLNQVVIARTPFNFGFLTRNFDLEAALKIPGHQLSNWSSNQLHKWSEIALNFKQYANDLGMQLDQLALRFILDTPMVNLVIPGAVKVSQLEWNLATQRLSPLPPNVYLELISMGQNLLEVTSPYVHKIKGKFQKN